MDTQSQFFLPEAETLLHQHGGPLTVPGQQGEYVVMRSDVYTAMLGLDDDNAAETLASVRRGIEDMKAGRTKNIDIVFDKFETRHES